MSPSQQHKVYDASDEKEQAYFVNFCAIYKNERHRFYGPFGNKWVYKLQTSKTKSI